jgi:1-acyl-sn-glycerol-3-phosphate acyltransferase
VILYKLGLPRLWGDDPERCWAWIRPWAARVTYVLAPGSGGYGVERTAIPTGPVVYAANHFTELDPSFVGIHSRRNMYYMSKLELLSMPIIGDSLRATGAFSVRRGVGDRDAVRMARWVVENGHAVGIFTEGTRQHLGYPGSMHTAAAMIAIQQGIPLVPCGVDTFGWSPKNRRACAVVWGEPLDLTGFPRNGKGYKEGAEIMEAEIVRLWRQAAQAAADGMPDELPDGTPKSSWIRPNRVINQKGLPTWPTEDWARNPLGPAYRAHR